MTKDLQSSQRLLYYYLLLSLNQYCKIVKECHGSLSVVLTEFQSHLLKGKLWERSPHSS